MLLNPHNVVVRVSVPIRMSHQDKEDDNVCEDVVEEELANFYSQVDVERVRGFTGDFAPRSDDVGELYEGMKFPTKAALRRHVKLYHIKNNCTFVVAKSGSNFEDWRCPKFGKECAWRLRATQKVNTYHWEITICPEKHKCVTMTLSQDHPKLDSDVIASFIISMVTLEPDVSVASIIERMNTQFNFEVSYKKTWLAKHKAITRVFGNWESSYSKLPRWMAAIQHFLPGTVVQFCYKPRPRGVPSDPSIRIFQRVFWAYKSCIDAFPHLKPMVQVDGTFLYGKYTLTLLIASSQDGNSNVVPLAFAIVEGETLEAWAWFLKRVRLHVVGDRQNICLISDRHPSILSAVSDPRTMWQPPYGHHVYCIRHLASNLNKKYNDSNLKDLFVNIGKWTCIDVHYHQRYDTLKKYKLLLDSLKEDQIKWRPYDEDHVSQQIPHYCIDNRHIWRANVPLICFHIVEWQYSDRVLRQFGMDQPIPENPVDIDFLHTLKLTGNILANWFIEHQFYIHVWNNWQARVAFAPPYHGILKRTSEYMKWYWRHTRRWIDVNGATYGYMHDQTLLIQERNITGPRFGEGGAGVAEVIDIIKRNFNGPYLSWSKIPQPIKDSWFKELKTKYWWYPESHDWVRWSFELCGCIEVKRSLWEARVNEQRPEWIDKSIWKQMCKHWEAKKKSKTNNNIQLNNKKTPFAASTSGTKDNKIKQEKLDQPIQSSSNKDKREKEIHHRIPPEVKEAMEIIMEEQEIVKGLIESMNQIWIQHVKNLEYVGPTFQLLPPPVNNSPEADFRRPPPGQFRHPNVSTFAVKSNMVF
ncbi:uncharacterized protein G2W53_041782 [Senna tora]|uniref:MULE transposase domain-containing protein n=1 Tax=Senna tora TaxID=362788 RepID=A0A834W1S1_9FABA|nr:uncharacterized protein G2W53_041782 [Senna tora]